MNPFLQIDALHHAYGDRVALKDFSLGVARGEIFGFLGPNGGGKTTLFKLLTTLRPLQRGSIRLEGADYAGDLRPIRRRIGAVFQSPALDKQLTVAENLRHQGRLYGMGGAALDARVEELLERFRIADRAKARVKELSGGLQRRVEVAKALIHRPELLLMDEPSTGLDPGIRLELWDYYEELRKSEGLTILMTTHLLEEAERCDRIALLDQGALIALGSPSALRTALGGRILRCTARDAAALTARLRGLTQHPVEVQGGEVCVRFPEGEPEAAPARLLAELAGVVDSASIARPTLADVYLAKVGRSWNG